MAIEWNANIPFDIRAKLELLFDTVEVDELIVNHKLGDEGRFFTKPLRELIRKVKMDAGGLVLCFLANGFFSSYNVSRIKHTLMLRYSPAFVFNGLVESEFLLNLNILKDLSIPVTLLPVDDAAMAVSERRSIAVIGDGVSPKRASLPCYTMTKAKELFRFPPNHPAPGTAYAMLDIYPDSYVLLNQFHDYYKQTKHAAFIELCASLGAKEILIESAEINNQELNINADVKTPLSKLGLGLSISQNRETGQTVAFKFSEKNREIKDYDSPWLHTEPTWMNMNNLRRRNHLAELGAEFTCLDDMGINADLSAKLLGVGVHIGGSFKEMTKIRLSYKVVFWE